MWRASRRAIQVGVARGRRTSSRPRPPEPRRLSRQSVAFIPPAAAIPSISRQRKQTPGRGHRREIERHSQAVKVQRGLEERIPAPARDARKRATGSLAAAAPGEASPAWNGRVPGCAPNSSQTSTPNSASAFDGRGKLHGLAHAVAPMRGVAAIRPRAIAGDGAEKRDGIARSAERSASASSSASAAGSMSG